MEVSKVYKPCVQALRLASNRATVQSTWRKMLLFIGIFFFIPGMCSHTYIQYVYYN